MKIERYLIIHKPRSRWDSKVKVELKNKKPTAQINTLFAKFNIEFPDDIFEDRFEIDIKIDKENTKKVKINANISDKFVNI